MGVVRVEDAERFIEDLEVNSVSHMAIKVLLLSIIDEAKKPNMRLKIREYVSDLDVECDRLCDMLEGIVPCPDPVGALGRYTALMEVKNDLYSRLNELI